VELLEGEVEHLRKGDETGGLLESDRT
jgi:hypothetical protein